MIRVNNRLNQVLVNWKQNVLQPNSFIKSFILRILEVTILTTFLAPLYFYTSFNLVFVVITIFIGGIISIFLSNIIYEFLFVKNQFIKKLVSKLSTILETITLSLSLVSVNISKFRWVGIFLVLMLFGNLLSNQIFDNSIQNENVDNVNTLLKLEVSKYSNSQNNINNLYTQLPYIWLKNDNNTYVEVNIKELNENDIDIIEAKATKTQVKLKIKNVKVNEINYSEKSDSHDDLEIKNEQNIGLLNQKAEFELNLLNEYPMDTKKALINRMDDNITELSFNITPTSTFSSLDNRNTTSIKSIIVSNVKLTSLPKDNK